MVISVSHLTDQVEIGGGGHAPILCGARGPAPPPSTGPRAPNPNTNPIPSPASDSYTSTRPGGYDDPFLCHIDSQVDQTFLLKYSWPPMLSSLCERCVVNNFRRNSARTLASRKECLCPKKSIRSIKNSTVR